MSAESVLASAWRQHSPKVHFHLQGAPAGAFSVAFPHGRRPQKMRARHCVDRSLAVKAAAASADEQQSSTEEDDAILSTLKLDSQGLLVAIAQHIDTGAILMQGFASKEAVATTMATGRATFFSRSRQSLWTKGETSSNFINVHQIYFDCDRDSVIYLGTPDGPTCHTGAETCYYTSEASLRMGGTDAAAGTESNPEFAMSTLYALEATIAARWEEVEKERAEEEAAVAAAAAFSSSLDAATVPAKKKPSWTKRLLTDPALLCSKIREEAGELCQTLEQQEGKERAASEMADLLYHAMVLLSVQGVHVEDVMAVLRKRFSQSGVEEKAGRRK